MSKAKIYVKVAAEFTPDGLLKPMWITWEDGRKFEIQRITDCRRAASLKAGGVGLRYTCIISGSPLKQFYEEKYKWFVEAKS